MRCINLRLTYLLIYIFIHQKNDSNQLITNELDMLSSFAHLGEVYTTSSLSVVKFSKGHYTHPIAA